MHSTSSSLARFLVTVGAIVLAFSCLVKSQVPVDPNNSGFTGFVVNGAGFPIRQNQFRVQFRPQQVSRTTSSFTTRITHFDPNTETGFPPRNTVFDSSNTNSFPTRNSDFDNLGNGATFPVRNTQDQFITTTVSRNTDFGQTRPGPGFGSDFRQPPTPEIDRRVTHQQEQPTQEPQQQQEQRRRPESQSMTESCLACICEASTSCQLATRCVSDGQYCGPFLISKPYWTDAGRPTLFEDSPDRDGAFTDCAEDPVCAAQAVRNYMTKYKKDCNGDGIVDCDDLARIHLMGPFGTECASSNVPSTRFYSKFSKCWATVQQLS